MTHCHGFTWGRGRGTDALNLIGERRLQFIGFNRGRDHTNVLVLPVDGPPSLLVYSVPGKGSQMYCFHLEREARMYWFYLGKRD